MRYLIVFALAFSPLAALAAGDSDVIDRYYELRADCRIGDTVTAEESAAACVELNQIGEQLTRAGYCWFKPEQEWRICD